MTCRSRPYDPVFDFLFSGQFAFYMNRSIDIVRLELSAEGLHCRCLIVKCHHCRIDTIGRQSVIIDVHGNLFLLGTQNLHIGQGRYGIKFILQLICILFQLPVALVIGLQGKEYRRNCTELIHYLNCKNSGWQKYP